MDQQLLCLQELRLWRKRQNHMEIRLDLLVVVMLRHPHTSTSELQFKIINFFRTAINPTATQWSHWIISVCIELTLRISWVLHGDNTMLSKCCFTLTCFHSWLHGGRVVRNSYLTGIRSAVWAPVCNGWSFCMEFECSHHGRLPEELD